MSGDDQGAHSVPSASQRIFSQHNGLSINHDTISSSSSTNRELKKDDVVYRKGERCVVVKVDYTNDPPSYVVRKPDGVEVGTERDRLELRDSDSSNLIRLTVGAPTGGLLGSETLSTQAAPQVTPSESSASSTSTIMAPSLSTPQDSLGVSFVQLPEFGLSKDRNGVRFFTVRVFPDLGSPWQIPKRYSQFLRLSRQLNDGVRRPFPKKHLFGCEGSKLERRRRGLETWLAAIVAVSESTRNSKSWISVLRQFLEVGLHDAPVAPPPPSANSFNPLYSTGSFTNPLYTTAAQASTLPSSSVPRQRRMF